MRGLRGFLLLLLGSYVAAQDGSTDGTQLPEQVFDVLDAWESGLGLIHQFDVEIDVFSQDIKTGTWRWSKKDDLERIRNQDILAGLDGTEDQTLYLDYFHDGKNAKILQGWDPDDPVELAPAEQNGIKAYIQPQVAGIPSGVGDPSVSLLFMFRDVTDVNESRQTLRQLVRAAARVEYDNKQDPEGKDSPHLRIWRRPSAPESAPTDYYDVYFDPSAGMMASRVVNHKANYAWPGEEGPIEWAEWVHVVTQFRDVGRGAFFPEKAELRVSRVGVDEPTGVVRFESTNLTVNQDLAADALAFVFPENAMVRYPVENGQRRVALWGADNRKVRDLNNNADVLAAQRAFAGTEAVSKPSYLLIIANVSLVLVVLGALAWRFYRKNPNAG